MGENDCDANMEGRSTPMLRFYPNCPLMMTHNQDVGIGLANGVQRLCQAVSLKPQHSVHYRSINGHQVKYAYA